MVNVLIVDDNQEYAIKLMNCLNKANENIKVYNIVGDGKKALDILNSKIKIDIVLLDLQMPVCTGNELIEAIFDKERYKNSIIVVSGEISNIKQIYKNDMIYSIIYKSTSINQIISKIGELVEVKNNCKIERNIRNKIVDEILKLNYDISNVGTVYLINAIQYIVTNIPNKEFNNLTSEVYPFIAKFNNTSVHNVKSNIARATNRMYYQCELTKLKKYFCYDVDTKPDSRTIIRTIINKIS